MDVAEVANLFGISQQYVRRLLPLHGIHAVRGYPTEQVLALHASRQEATMSTTVDRAALLDDAAEIIRTLPEDKSVSLSLADELLDAIHAQWPHLQALLNLWSLQSGQDQDRYQKSLAPGAEIDLLDGYKNSEETRLAWQAYQTAMRAAVLGRKP